uniref:Uncharacterized protein n=1 Tax=Oryza meridionalis TaxID=40149 RepID=A0A0E0CL88_9ORYZ
MDAIAPPPLRRVTMEAAVAILALPAVEAEAAAATAPGRMAANSVSSISKGGAVIRRYTMDHDGLVCAADPGKEGITQLERNLGRDRNWRFGDAPIVAANSAGHGW